MNRKLSKSIFFITIIAVLSSLTLSGCSGGSSGGTPSLPPPPPPGAPTLNLSVAMKQLQLSWDLVDGATYYRVSENANGVSGFSQIGGDLDSTATSYDHEISVHLQDWANARYLIEACNESGCTASNEINAASSSANAIGYIKASNSDSSDNFGRTVAISGDGETMAVGAHGEASAATRINGDKTNNDTSLSGAAYVYAKNENGTWEQQAYIKGSSATTNKWFGWDVALSEDGNTLAVSALRDGKTVAGSGVVYIYGRDGTGTWSEKAILEPSNPEMATQTGPIDRFGFSIALSTNGDALIVGAPSEDSDAAGIDGDGSNNRLADSGAAYLFTRDETGAWSPSTYFKASNPGSEIAPLFYSGLLGDNFGWDVDISADGQAIIVAAPGEDSNANTVDGNQTDNSLKQSGAAYIFKKAPTGWQQKAYLKASNPDGGWTGSCGFLAQCIQGDQFGHSVAINGNGTIVSIGALNEESASTDPDDNSLRLAGAVYIFSEKADQSWQEDAYIKAYETSGFTDPANTVALGDTFGCSIDLDSTGSFLVVGACNEDGNSMGINGDATINSIVQSGAAYLFKKNVSGDWLQISYIKPNNTDGNSGANGFYSGDNFGSAISISSDGAVLAIGAGLEKSDSNVINEGSDDNSLTNAGAVYLY